MLAKFRRMIASLLVVSIAGLGLPLPAHAGMVGTDAAVASSHRERIAGFLERSEVREQLKAQGVNPAEVKLRVAALTDDEAAQLAAHMDSMPAGGVLGLLLLVFVILLITDILGLTKVFPFTRPVR